MYFLKLEVIPPPSNFCNQLSSQTAGMLHAGANVFGMVCSVTKTVSTVTSAELKMSPNSD